MKHRFILLALAALSLDFALFFIFSFVAGSLVPPNTLATVYVMAGLLCLGLVIGLYCGVHNYERLRHFLQAKRLAMEHGDWQRLGQYWSAAPRRERHPDPNDTD